MKHCSRGIIILRKHVVLIRRVRRKKEYYVLPGGHIEKEESSRKACVREIKEETNLDCEVVKRIESVIDGKNHKTVYYICKLNLAKSEILPKLILIGEEKEQNKPNNFYEPMWVQVKKLGNITMYPYTIKEKLMNNNLIII